jgi:subtilisin family serine protease
VAAVLSVLGAQPASPNAGSALEVSYTSPAALAALLRSHPARILRRLPELRLAELRPVDGTSEFVRAARRWHGIASAQPVERRTVADGPAVALGLVSTPAGGAYEWQYYAAGVDRVPPSVLAAAARVTIAVLDTGVDLTAPGLARKVLATYDVRTGSRAADDQSGHGTFVSSLAAGATTAAGGIIGFGGDVRLLVVKIAQSSAVTDVDVASGITYAVDHGAKVINVSVAGTSRSVVEQRAIAYAAAHGALLVAAAGNDALSGNPAEYPAAFLQPPGSNGGVTLGLSVVASDFGGSRAAFSEHGSFVSLAAPGVSVFGLLSSGSCATGFTCTQLPGSASGAYGFASGTSFASAEVAGAAALVWAAAPRMTSRDVIRTLEQSASGRGMWSPELGFGVLDVGRAVALARSAR